MAIEMITGNAINATLAQMPIDIVNRLRSLITIFQAIGGLIIVYIIFHIINLFLNRKRAKEMNKMRELHEKIDKKLDKRK